MIYLKKGRKKYLSPMKGQSDKTYMQSEICKE